MNTVNPIPRQENKKFVCVFVQADDVLMLIPTNTNVNYRDSFKFQSQNTGSVKVFVFRNKYISVSFPFSSARLLLQKKSFKASIIFRSSPVKP